MSVVRLSHSERLVLANQYAILQKIDPEQQQLWSLYQNIVENGFTSHYGDLFSAIEDEMPIDDCREVMDILDMFRAFHNSLALMRDKSGLDQERFRFQGFDGNNETVQWAFARFLIHDQKGWVESDTGELNSHRRILETYRAMLVRWRDSQDIWSLTQQDMLRIAGLGF